MCVLHFTTLENVTGESSISKALYVWKASRHPTSIQAERTKVGTMHKPEKIPEGQTGIQFIIVGLALFAFDPS